MERYTSRIKIVQTRSRGEPAPSERYVMAKRNDPPVVEPEGYRSTAGFVKSRPENNKHYLEQYRDWSFYSILTWLDRELQELIPGYNISQIKMKFNELRFYFDYPAEIPIREDWKAYDSVEKIQAMVKSRITYAEGYVSGYQVAENEFKKPELPVEGFFEGTNSVRATLELLAKGSFAPQTEKQRKQAEDLVKVIYEAEGKEWQGVANDEI
jgi:hypothetical protein